MRSIKIFLISILPLLLVACGKVEYAEKKQDTKIDPSKTTLLELFDGIQESWEKNRDISRIYIVAHRGNTLRSAKEGIPDNSIPNIEAAIAAGADMVELDVRTTKDGEFVLMHNAGISGTTTGKGNVSNLTLDQIKSYAMTKDGKVYVGPDGKNCFVPTLEEAFKATKDRIYVNLDVANKGNSIAKLIKVIEDCGVRDQVMIYGAGSDGFSEISSKDPLIAIHPYISNPNDVRGYVNFFGAVLFQYDSDTYYNSTIPEFGKKVHELGKLSYSNLLDYDEEVKLKNYSAIDKFLVSGSDFIQTDVCEIVDEYLDALGYR